MHVLSLAEEREFDPRAHVERVLAVQGGGDISVACWEPGQVSPYHCHPEATEIYLCLEGEGVMRTPDSSVHMTTGSVVVHPPGELHEFENGSVRSMLFRVRYGSSMAARVLDWRGHPDWRQPPEDIRYFEGHSGAGTDPLSAGMPPRRARPAGDRPSGR